MASKLMFGVVLMATVVAVISAFPAGLNWNFPKIVEAACLVTNTTTGLQKHNEVCKCSGDKTVACDVGPVKIKDRELTFCNKLDSQTIDDLYILHFACKSGVDQNCGTSSSCDLGPLTYEGTEYYLCPFAPSVGNVDMTDKCLPELAKMLPKMFGNAFGQSPFGGVGGGFGSAPQKPKRPKNMPMFHHHHNMPMFPQDNMPMFADDDVTALPQQNAPKNQQPNVPVNPPQYVPQKPQPNVPVNPPQYVPQSPQPNVPVNPPQYVPQNQQPNVPSFPQMNMGLQQDPFQNMFQDQDFDFPQWDQGMGGFFRQHRGHFPW